MLRRALEVKSPLAVEFMLQLKALLSINGAYAHKYYSSPGLVHLVCDFAEGKPLSDLEIFRPS